MRPLSPLGVVGSGISRAEAGSNGAEADAANEEHWDARYVAWEIARCAPALAAEETVALEALATACILAVQAGSTRLPLDARRLRVALAEIGAQERLPAVEALIDRARAGDVRDPVCAVLGSPGERKPLIVEGPWLYPERMRLLEERFCGRVRLRAAGDHGGAEAKRVARAVASVASGPPALTDAQRRAVREALVGPIALVTGGPGTGKTSIVVAVLRALAWLGVPMEAVAVAAPTGKAAQRLRDAITVGLACAPRDLAEAAFRTAPPSPQTLHRLLGWSPSRGRFARHENDPLAHRVVIVDEATMVDLAMMDRLVRALPAGARLVLLGDADQLPSVEAGAVFRDLCAGLGAARLTTNLRVLDDPLARRIVDAAGAVNRGALDATFREAVATRRSVGELSFQGVEHLDAAWSDVADELLERWWAERIAALPGFDAEVSRSVDPSRLADDAAEHVRLRALLAHFGRARLLCATRTRGEASVRAINEALIPRLPSGRGRGAANLPAGTPVLFDHNDYERDVYNGDQGLVVSGDSGRAAVFARGTGFVAIPMAGAAQVTAAFAMTVHKAQGSEFDHVAVVLPDVDAQLLTRELVYTAITRARRSVVLVGPRDLLERAVSRSVERHCGIAERLAKTTK